MTLYCVNSKRYSCQDGNIDLGIERRLILPSNIDFGER
jgi:hypothetical protein